MKCEIDNIVRTPEGWVGKVIEPPDYSEQTESYCALIAIPILIGKEILEVQVVLEDTDLKKASKKSLNEQTKKNLIKPPLGFRFITKADKDSIRGLSSYLDVYPKLLHFVSKYDILFKQWTTPGPYKYFWDDTIYAVPEGT